MADLPVGIQIKTKSSRKCPSVNKEPQVQYNSLLTIRNLKLNSRGETDKQRTHRESKNGVIVGTGEAS